MKANKQEKANLPRRHFPEHPDFGEHPRERSRELFWGFSHFRPVSQARKFPILYAAKLVAAFSKPSSRVVEKESERLEKACVFGYCGPALINGHGISCGKAVGETLILDVVLGWRWLFPFKKGKAAKR